MKTINQNTVLLVILTLTSLAFQSCKKFITVGPPKNSITTEYVFDNNQSAIAAVDGIYSVMANGSFGELNFVNGQLSLYGGLSADELYHFSPNASLEQFRTNQLLSNNFSIRSLWSQVYSRVYQTNACIASLTDNEKIDFVIRQRLIGESKFLRAYCYLYILQLMENIPLVTSIDYLQTATLKNASKTEVYSQIIADLTDASALLSVDYVQMDKGRPNKWAASALLARAYLYKGDWTNAETTASQIIDNSAIYNLNDDPGGAFLKNNPEAILQLAPGVADRNTPEGFSFIPATVPIYVLTDELLASFEATDQRKASWVGEFDYMGTPYFFPFKYKIKEGPSVEEYITLLRFAEQYLIRAEARANLENLDGATADINIIRNRADLDDLDLFSDKNACLLAIEQERRIEFFAEHGHRWIDLVRTNRATAVLSLIKTGWDENDRLYPIPISEIDKSQLEQNDGY